MLLAPFSRDHLADPFDDWPQWRKDMGLGPHRGTDWNGLDAGTPIPASGVGTVVWRTNMTDAQAERTALGHRIVIAYKLDDDSEIRIGYSHLHRNPTLAVGDTVRLGTAVGLLGNSGTATTGDHLHMTASWTTGDPGSVAVVDPMQFLTFGSALAGVDDPTILTNQSEEDTMAIIIKALGDDAKGRFRKGHTFVDNLDAPLVLLSAAEVGALEYYAARGVPFRKAEWGAGDLAALISVRGMRPFDPKTGRADYTRVTY